MALAQLERSPALDGLGDLIERGSERFRTGVAQAGDAAGVVAGQADEALAGLTAQAEGIASGLGAEARRVAGSPDGRRALLLLALAAMVISLSALIVLARRRTRAVRRRMRSRT